MSDSTLLASRLLVTAATLAYAVGPFVIDMNRTHLLHPAWPGHARFHLLWSAVSQLAVGAIAGWLTWTGAGDEMGGIRLAAGIGLALNSGFWIALLFRRGFRGTLHDPGGVPPIGGRVDGNLIAVFVITTLLVMSLLLLPAGSP